ncbi:MAG: 4'-phosphopantetheinyl transferase superfamily protein [Clostridia bacterium]|nr:4'-phosphopantetheinyl transferase superfamily protein [Clostridia bacterium]
MELYYFNINEKEVNKEKLPETVLSHCKKKESFLAAEALINMGVDGLHYNEKKKPLADNCFVSISHSGNMVAVCKSQKPIGIDIEKIDKSRSLEKIANRFYHGKELELFNKNPTAETFFEIWTLKEAYSKISGEGVGEVFEGFDVFSLSDYNFKTEKIDEYMLSVCEKT